MRAAVAVLVAAFALAAPPLLGRARADQPLPDRFRLQLQVGATVALSDGSPRVALAGSFGVALGHDRRAFVLLSPEVEFLDATVTRVLVPLGFEYDVPLGAAGPLRFSFFPRISIGYAAIVTADAVAHAGVVMPELGFRVDVSRRWHLALVPFSLPIYLSAGSCDAATMLCSGSTANAAYRATAAAGVSF